MFAQIFSPTISYRLFDPMPLPKVVRERKLIRAKRAAGTRKSWALFTRIVKIVPVNS